MKTPSMSMVLLKLCLFVFGFSYALAFINSHVVFSSDPTQPQDLNDSKKFLSLPDSETPKSKKLRKGTKRKKLTKSGDKKITMRGDDDPKLPNVLTLK